MITSAHQTGSYLATWTADYLAEHVIDEDVAALIHAALVGAGTFDGFLADATGDQPLLESRKAVSPDSGVFLQRLEVSGFRGIGPEAFIGFKPMPGLTIVSGRNGSGKSSFSEAIEIALTGTAHRWNKQNMQFEPEHRNLHQGDPCRIRLDLLHEGEHPPRIEVAWDPSAERHAFRRTLQRADRLPEDGIGSLGWDQALVTYRPLLSYEELGQVLAGRQSDIANAVQRALGLSELTAAKALINTRAKEAQQPRDREKAVRLALRQALEEVQSDDARVSEALENFATKSLRKNVDLARARELATGGDSSPTQMLDPIINLQIPAAGETEAAANELSEAIRDVDSSRQETDRFDDLHRQLLVRALHVHDQAGDMACPVCWEGRLDATWRTRVQTTLDASGEAARVRDQAADRLRRAQAGGRSLVNSLPGTAIQHPFDLATQQAALAAWTRWASLPSDERTWPEHLEGTYAELSATTEAWQAEARQVAQERQDVWAPLAIQLGEWVAAREAYEANLAAETRLADAKKVMGELEKAAQSERLAPITEQAQHIWNQLKQESNVDVADIALGYQKLEITAEVDGKPAGALRVMSQGELHGLALALFLPRVTMADSPFRFVVLDDPVQAMDPAKVEGLLSVLLEIAQTHQVIVLSHDDRLADAARRRDSADGAIRILEVQRAENSVVNVAAVLDSVERHIKDAWALYNDERMPLPAKCFVIPGILRMALESAAHERFFTRELGYGRKLAELEREWEDAYSTVRKVRLAVSPLEVHVWAHSAQRRSAITMTGEKSHTGINPQQLEAGIKAVMWASRDLRDDR